MVSIVGAGRSDVRDQPALDVFGDLACRCFWQLGRGLAVPAYRVSPSYRISSLSLGHWAIHSLVMGMLFSLPPAFSGPMAPDGPEFSKTSMRVWRVLLGMVYGLLIEVITSVFFKAGQKK